MANHKSAAKRARQSVRKSAVNTRRTSKSKTNEKGLLKALAEKNVKALPELLKSYTSQLMKSAQKGVFKKETAARKIGRISKRVSAALMTK